jgi:molybdate transport system substrate-binding protein
MQLHCYILPKSINRHSCSNQLIRVWTIVFLITGGFLNQSCSEISKTESLNIAVAANMQIAMDSIALVYQQKKGVELLLSSNSSGMLTSQIIEGAPFDLFLSANSAYPKKLIETGFTESMETYAYGRLALVYKGLDSLKSIHQVLSSNQVTRIGVANKISSPYGFAGFEFLNHLKSYEINDKVVFGENIGQINQYIKSGSVDAAFTCNSFIVKFKGEYNYIFADPNDFSPINQTVCALTHGLEEKSILVSNFISFLHSSECKGILTHFGYIVD